MVEPTKPAPPDEAEMMDDCPTCHGLTRNGGFGMVPDDGLLETYADAKHELELRGILIPGTTVQSQGYKHEAAGKALFEFFWERDRYSSALPWEQQPEATREDWMSKALLATDAEQPSERPKCDDDPTYCTLDAGHSGECKAAPHAFQAQGPVDIVAVSYETSADPAVLREASNAASGWSRELNSVYFGLETEHDAIREAMENFFIQGVTWERQGRPTEPSGDK